MDNSICDVALGEQDGHGPAEADDHGGGDGARHALAELHAGLGGVQPEQDHTQDGDREVDGGDLRQAPGPEEGAEHGEHDGGQEHDDENHPFGVKLQPFLKLHGSGLLLEVVLTHHAVLGVLLDLDAVAQQEEQGDDIEHHQAHRPEGDAGVHGQTHQGLGHAGGIGVDHAAGEAHGGGQQDNRGAHHLVIA